MQKRYKLVGPQDKALSTISSPLDLYESVPWLKNLLTILRMSKNGIGIAANQIGVTKRLIIVRDFRDQIWRVMANPELVQKTGSVYGPEGCLSYPGVTAYVTRPQSVILRYQAVTDYRVTNKEVLHSCEDLEARCFCHELDHLNGICEVGNAAKRNRIGASV